MKIDLLNIVESIIFDSNLTAIQTNFGLEIHCDPSGLGFHTLESIILTILSSGYRYCVRMLPLYPSQVLG